MIDPRRLSCVTRCTVLLNTRSPGIGNGLTYDAGDLNLAPGMLVSVPLRARSVEGIVLSLDGKNDADTFDPKPVEKIIGLHPLIGAAQVNLMRWMAGHYWCSLGSAIRPFLPAPPWRNAVEKDDVIYRLGEPLEKGGKRQMEILAYLKGKGTVLKDTLKRDVRHSSTTLKSLIDKGHVIEERRAPDAPSTPQAYDVREARPAFTPAQQKAYEDIATATKPSLLFGITGSGKTEIYAALIADAAAKGKQTIMLVPEILLTAQTTKRFERLFDPDRIAIMHSKLTPAAKRLEWMRVHSGEAALVIGSRSALFAPCDDLGLVIIDEEHEWTYKNEQTPRYHARETAEKLCEFTGAKLVLGSATPSLEAWSRAKEGRYELVRLAERYKNRPLPNVRVVDLATVKFGSLYPFSPPLLQAMEERLAKKEQIVLFLNRRGAASAVLCLQCRKRLTSPASMMPFTVHKTPDGRPYLMDHIGGVRAEMPATCPYCGSAQLLAIGAGTQRIEELIATIFPNAKTLRADSDTLKHPEQMKGLLADMNDKKADILLGTQSVVKGLDIAGVTLAAVLIADIGMSLPHFRAGERTFQLLTQLAGRSGRAVPGDVIIQTFRPDASEIVAAAAHRTEDWLETERNLRAALRWPPEVDMIRFTIDGDRAEARAKKLQQALTKAIAEKSSKANALLAPTFFGGGREWHILLKGEHIRELLPSLDLADVTVDVDPVDVV